MINFWSRPGTQLVITTLTGKSGRTRSHITFKEGTRPGWPSVTTCWRIIMAWRKWSILYQKIMPCYRSVFIEIKAQALCCPNTDPVMIFFRILAFTCINEKFLETCSWKEQFPREHHVVYNGKTKRPSLKRSIAFVLGLEACSNVARRRLNSKLLCLCTRNESVFVFASFVCFVNEDCLFCRKLLLCLLRLACVSRQWLLLPRYTRVHLFPDFGVDTRKLAFDIKKKNKKQNKLSAYQPTV